MVLSTYTLKSEPGAACLVFDESILGRDKYPDSEGISSVIAKFEMAKNIHLEMCFLIFGYQCLAQFLYYIIFFPISEYSYKLIRGIFFAISSFAILEEMASVLLSETICSRYSNLASRFFVVLESSFSDSWLCWF